MSEATLEKVQLERDSLAKELQLVQCAIPKEKARRSAVAVLAAASIFFSLGAHCLSLCLFPSRVQAAEQLIAFMAEKQDPFNAPDNQWATASGDSGPCCTVA